MSGARTCDINALRRFLMTAERKTLLVPISLIVLGTGWLLTAMGVMPQVDWAWTLGVGAVGVLAFVIGGIDKITVVVGPFFILASCLSLLRQTERLSIDKEIPVLVIAAGILLLVARAELIPAPGWLVPSHDKRSKEQPMRK
jgi:hypothetical protein